MGIIGWIIFWVDRRGHRQSPHARGGIRRWIVTILLGIAGALVGAFWAVPWDGMDPMTPRAF
jgi:hypothetical protein